MIGKGSADSRTPDWNKRGVVLDHIKWNHKRPPVGVVRVRGGKSLEKLSENKEQK